MNSDGLLQTRIALLQEAVEALNSSIQREDSAQDYNTKLLHTVALQTSASFAKLYDCLLTETANVLPRLVSAQELFRTSVSELLRSLVRCAGHKERLTWDIKQQKMELDLSYNALVNIATHNGFILSTAAEQPVSENISNYVCFASDYEQFTAQATWEHQARSHNTKVYIYEQMQQEHLRCLEQILDAENSFMQRINNIEFPRVRQFVGASSSALHSVVQLEYEKLSFDLQYLENLIYSGDIIDAAAFANRLERLDDTQKQKFWKRNQWFLAGSSIAPIHLRQQAAARCLQEAVKNPEKAYRALGFSARELSLAQFKEEITQLNQTLVRIPNAAVLSIGKHDQQLTAQVVLGDLKSAKSITVLVPGMNSKVGEIGNLVGAANNLRETIKNKGAENTAIVVWQGYDSPHILEEPRTVKASKGALRLAEDIKELQEFAPQAKHTVIGHSYGSTTAAEALKHLDVPVTNFITVGSAGLVTGTIREQLAAEHIFASTAAPEAGFEYSNWVHKSTAQKYLEHPFSYVDIVAWIGIATGNHRVDPRYLKDSQVLPANSFASNHIRVGKHAINNEKAADGKQKRGYFNLGTQTIEAVAEVIAAAEKRNY